MEPLPGDTVRLAYECSGMPGGSEGVLVGWYALEDREALVRFWDGGPLRVPVDAIEAGGDEAGGDG